MYLSIIFMPLIGSITSGFLGRKLGTKGAQVITTASVFLTTMLALVAYFEVSLNHTPVSIHLFRWIDSENLHVSWGFNFDSLTVSMLIPVLIVSSLVHLYSIGYMNNDPHNQRFFSYLSLFTFMMIILVTGNNYLLMFVGWEGVGVCSYLLVSFWFTRIAANQSSLAAFLTNRVGDCFLTIGMFVLLLTFGNINYNTIFSLTPYISEDIITLIGILLLLGAMAKSSQIGLHVWLPMAMEGPTPVSALIHAATMVTAGVYLLMRSSPLIEYSSTVLLLCLWIGAITTVFSSLIGLFQQDIKKVIAYSTMSQLGMMVIAVGLSSYNLALFHLVNHAFYKALLFLGAGSVIHAVADNQDFRKYGGLRAFLPLTYSVMLIASLSLVAFPFMTGFYSKDFILESAYGNFSYSTTSVYFIALIGAMFTTLYSVKVLYLTFLTTPNGPQSSYKIAHEGDIYMSLPLIILAIFSIGFGYLTKDLFIGLGSDVFSDNSIFIHPNHEITLDTEFAVPHFFKLLPLAFTITLSLIYIAFSEFIFTKSIISFKLSRFGYNVYSFFNQRFLIEAFYNKFITNAILNVGGQTTKVIDKGTVELLGPFGLETFLIYLSNKVNKLSTSLVTTCALFITIAVVSYLTLTSLAGLDSSGIMCLFPMLAPTRHRANGHSLVYNACSKAFFSCTSINYRITGNDDITRRLREEEQRRLADEGLAEDVGRRLEEAVMRDLEMRDVNSQEGATLDITGNYDPTNGTLLDDTSKIKENCTTEREAKEYFETKKAAMIRNYENDIASYQEEDEDTRYSDDLESWKVAHQNDLGMLETQRREVMSHCEGWETDNEESEDETKDKIEDKNDNSKGNGSNGGNDSGAGLGGSSNSSSGEGPSNSQSNNSNMELPLNDKTIKDVHELSNYYLISEFKLNTTSLEKVISNMLKLINELFSHYI